MAQHATRRLRNLKVASVDLVDDGDNPGARFVLFKRLRKWLKGDEIDEPTDEERELFGKAFHLPGQASSAADCPPGWRFVPERRMCVREAHLSKQQPSVSSVHVDSTEGDRARRRARRGRGALDGENLIAKLTISTEEQESGGVSPHPHTLELPDGPLSAGTFRTEEEQEHRHDVVLTQDLASGQTVTVETGPAIPDPPAGVDQHTHAATITASEEVAARRNQLDKQDEDFQTRDGQRFRRNAFAFAPAGSNPSEWKLALFDTQADADANRPSVGLTANAAQALGSAGFRGQQVEIPGDARGGVINRVRAAWLRARRLADQDVSRDDLPDVLKRSMFGRITEAFYKWAGLDSPSEDLEQLLEDELDDFDETPARASTTEEEGMDLSKLSKEDREKVEKALEAAGSVEEFAKNFKNLQEMITKGAEVQAKLAKLEKSKDDDDDEDPLEGVPEEIRKIVEPQMKAANDRAAAVEKVNVLLKERLDKLEANAERATFEKSIGDLNGIPQKRGEIVDMLYKITDEKDRDQMRKNLEAAAAAVRRGGEIFGELGGELDGGGSAYAKISAAAVEIRKANPKLTEAAAKAQAMNENPELYAAYLEEDAGPVN